MTKVLNILSYYILLLLGLIATSWIIWGRFLRERVIRDIPDASLTEIRFWILFYLCCIYILIIKNLIREPKSNFFISTIGKVINPYFWKPLTTLDYAIKYNIYCKDYYYKFMIQFSTYWATFLSDWSRGFILCFQVIPRIILVTILLLDILNSFFFYSRK